MEKSKLAHRREDMEREPHSPSMRELREIISGGSCTAYIFFPSISQTGDSFLVSIPMEHTHLHANRGGKSSVAKKLVLVHSQHEWVGDTPSMGNRSFCVSFPISTEARRN